MRGQRQPTSGMQIGSSIASVNWPHLPQISRRLPNCLSAAVGPHDVCNAVAQGDVHAPHVGAVRLCLIQHLLHTLQEDWHKCHPPGKGS
jgi:hypothetical protein